MLLAPAPAPSRRAEGAEPEGRGRQGSGFGHDDKITRHVVCFHDINGIGRKERLHFGMC